MAEAECFRCFFAWSLVDALEYIPQDHSGYADMIKWTKGLAETLSKYQDKVFYNEAFTEAA